MPNPETLVLYASILEKPYMDCERSKEYPNGRLRPAVEINRIAAEALRRWAEQIVNA